ncbi:hypothetical protein ACHAW5_010228 [Stephanodiscus triporus]|uniref:peptidylprolyl isomerase n=1 Tax=Stephanodiscus triporus TaxID=2934178 RepID=A0ABD3NQX6_9STRA
MSILLETTFGDMVLDLDVDGSPALSKNVLKLVKARYYTNTLVYNVVPGKYCQVGDPRGDGSGGCSIYGLIDSYRSAHADDVDSRRDHDVVVVDGGGAAAAAAAAAAAPTLPPPDVSLGRRRFLRSVGRALTSAELRTRGTVVATEMGGLKDTIGSQFLISLGGGGGDVGDDDDDDDDDGHVGTTDDVEADGGDRLRRRRRRRPVRLSLGKIVEDESGVLSKIDRSYCDDDGRPYADVRIVRALVIRDPYDDPNGMDDLLRWRGVGVSMIENDNNATTTTTIAGGGSGDDDDDDLLLAEGRPLAPYSPSYDRPPEEVVPVRVPADDEALFATAGWDVDDINDEDDDDEDGPARRARMELREKQEEEWRKRQDASRAVVLEMLGDRPTAEIAAPENVLFVCKLNPLTDDDDLGLIFARFDPKAKAEVIRDPDTGASLQYAFVEFSSNEACNEAYLKMNNALVDNRRIRVDFSQSVAKVWDRYNKKYRIGDRGGGIVRGFDGGGGGGGGGVNGERGGGRGRIGRGGGGRGRGPGPGPGRGYVGGAGHHSRDGSSHHPPDGHRRDHRIAAGQDERGSEGPEFDGFGRIARQVDANESRRGRHSGRRDEGKGRSHHPRDNSRSRSRSRSRSPSRDTVEGERKRRSGSGSRGGYRGSSRRSRSRSGDRSSDSSRRRKKHHRSKHHRRKDISSRDERSRSRERERKRKRRHHRHRHRRDDSSDEEDERRIEKHHRRREDDDLYHSKRSGAR